MSAMLFVIAWLHPRVFSKSHSNTLEDFIYVTHCAMEYVAMMRANAAIDLLIARPWRWLAGNGSKLAQAGLSNALAQRCQSAHAQQLSGVMLWPRAICYTAVCCVTAVCSPLESQNFDNGSRSHAPFRIPANSLHRSPLHTRQASGFVATFRLVPLAPLVKLHTALRAAQPGRTSAALTEGQTARTPPPRCRPPRSPQRPVRPRRSPPARQPPPSRPRPPAPPRPRHASAR